MSATRTKKVELDSIRNAASILKVHAQRADMNGDGKLTQTEAEKYGSTVKDRGATKRALVSMTRWALAEQQRGDSVMVT